VFHFDDAGAAELFKAVRQKLRETCSPNMCDPIEITMYRGLDYSEGVVIEGGVRLVAWGGGCKVLIDQLLPPIRGGRTVLSIVSAVTALWVCGDLLLVTVADGQKRYLAGGSLKGALGACFLMISIRRIPFNLRAH
jgi:hypothetical protein